MNFLFVLIASMTITDQGAGIGWYELFTHYINIFSLLFLKSFHDSPFIVFINFVNVLPKL